MARYLRDPSRDDPLPRSFRHRGLHHGPGSTQNQARPGLEIRRAGLHGCVDPAAGSLPSLTQGHPPPPGPNSPTATCARAWKLQVEGAGEKAGDTERGGDGGTCRVHEVLREARQFPRCPAALLPAAHGTAAGARAASCQVSSNMCQVPGTVWGHEPSLGASLPQVPKRAAARNQGSGQTELIENYPTGSGQAGLDLRSACLQAEPRATL